LRSYKREAERSGFGDLLDDVRTVELYEPVAFDVLLRFSGRQYTAGPFQNLCRQYPVACDGFLGEVGFDREPRADRLVSRAEAPLLLLLAFAASQDPDLTAQSAVLVFQSLKWERSARLGYQGLSRISPFR
jgi:hypothetical protein